MTNTIIDINGVELEIKSNKELSQKIIDNVLTAFSSLNIYWCDDTAKHWSFDTKLSNKLWIENITFNNELTAGKALILN